MFAAMLGGCNYFVSTLQIMQKKYYSNFDEILSDPHAFSDPIQELNVSNGREGYLEIEGIYRAKGKVSVTWANTYFHEINATQELKVDVSESGEYAVTLRALGVPAATRLRFEAGASRNEVTLTSGKKFHSIGRVRLEAGKQSFALTLLETADLDKIEKMGLWWASKGQAHRPTLSTSNHSHDRPQTQESSMDFYL